MKKKAEDPNDHETTPPETSDDSSSDESDLREKHVEQSRDVLFAFGPDRSYFIYTNPKWQYHGNTTIVNGLPDTIRPPYTVAFTPEGDLFLAYKSEHLSPAWTWIKSPEQVISTSAAEKWAKRKKAYTDLFDSIADSSTSSLTTLRNVSVAIGPHGSYYAATPSGPLSHNLPADLSAAIAARAPTAPTHVALGINGTWIALWPDRSCTYNVGSYEKLTDNLTTTRNGAIVFAALDAHDAEHYFVVYENGMTSYNVPSVGKGDWIGQATNAYMQVRAKADGTTFSFKHWNKVSQTQVTISPQTRYEYPGVEEKGGKGQFRLLGMERDFLGSAARRMELYRLGRRENLVAMGSAALSTAAACRVMRLSGGATMLAAGAAAGGTGALCLWLQKF